MSIPEFDEIIEPNDQTEARREHLSKLRDLIGNAYPNKYERSKITGAEDTISNVVHFAPVAELAKELKDATPEGAKPDQDLKAHLNEKLKAFGNVRVSGRLAVPPRVMGKAAFVHLSDGVERLQTYFRKGDFTIDVETWRRGDAENNAELGGDIAASPIHRVSVSPEESWEAFKLLDHGDFIGAEGFLFLTNTGELSVHVETFQFLSKSLLPMPDKLHGIADPELRRRYRYADLIADSLKVEHEPNELTTREVFERRAKLISGMRRFLDDHDYIEVETPMLTPKATGAAAKPFATHHNALDIPLYARIAPELYLKRLTVGGFEKVYELNRNFRNEGLSQRHNPEFTMLEFYCAYMDVNGMMDFSERMIQEAVKKATGGSLQVKYGWADIDFSKFERLTMKEAIHKELSFNDSDDMREAIADGVYPAGRFLTLSDLLGEIYDASWLDDAKKLRTFVVMGEKNKLPHSQPTRDYQTRGKLIGETLTEERIEERRIKNEQTIEKTTKLWQEAVTEVERTFDDSKDPAEQAARDLIRIFEESVEPNLTQPTFITDYPKIISPLSKASPANSQIAERFELFIAGMECANGFSELNDPQEQYERFVDQMRTREAGDDEAMVMDEDYIRALAYGMPPAAGIGIGIDRLVMLLTNKHSIRDVILFPHMRPERRADEAEKSSENESAAPVNPS